MANFFKIRHSFTNYSLFIYAKGQVEVTDRTKKKCYIKLFCSNLNNKKTIGLIKNVLSMFHDKRTTMIKS